MGLRVGMAARVLHGDFAVEGGREEGELDAADDVVLVLLGEYLGQPKARDTAVDLVDNGQG